MTGLNHKAIGWAPPDLPASMCQTEIDVSVNDKQASTMKINRIGVDLAKNVFQLHGADVQINQEEDHYYRNNECK